MVLLLATGAADESPLTKATLIYSWVRLLPLDCQRIALSTPSFVSRSRDWIAFAQINLMLFRLRLGDLEGSR
jgi:hypothetical protein